MRLNQTSTSKRSNLLLCFPSTSRSLFLFALVVLSLGLKLDGPQKNYLRRKIRRKGGEDFKALWSLFSSVSQFVFPPHHRSNCLWGFRFTSKVTRRAGQGELPRRIMSCKGKQQQKPNIAGERWPLHAVLHLGHQMASLSHWNLKSQKFMTHVSEESGSARDCSACPRSFHSLWKTWMKNGSFSHLDMSRVVRSCSGTTCTWSTANTESADHTGLVQTQVWTRGVVACYALWMAVNTACPRNIQSWWTGLKDWTSPRPPLVLLCRAEICVQYDPVFELTYTLMEYNKCLC